MKTTQEILAQMSQEAAALPGMISYYYENLVTHENASYCPDLPIIAASVIKIPVMTEFFFQVDEGKIDPFSSVTVHAEDKLPSCGVLNYLHTGLQVSNLDLCTLMIIVSDNTATNLLIKKLGMENINARMCSLGLQNIGLTRLLFDGEAARRGLENRITSHDIGKLLKMIYEGKLPHSDQMLSILSDQRLNGKMPFLLDHVPMAHKTGEDGGITHDVGIILGKVPFILCFLSEKTKVPDYERWIQDKTFLLWQATEQREIDLSK